MSATILYALVMLQGGDINITPDFTSKAECQSAAPTTGGLSSCQPYSPDGKTWTLFFRHPYGIRYVYRLPTQNECEAYRSIIRPEVASSCRPLDVPINCEPAVANINPAALGLTGDGRIRTASGPAPLVPRPRPETAVIVSPASTIQLAGGHYEPGFRWVEELPKAASAIKESDKPYLEPAVVEPPPKQIRTAERRNRQPQTQQFDPLGAFVAVITAPIRFATYPGRRDW